MSTIDSTSAGPSRRDALVMGLGGLFMLTADTASAQAQQNLTFWTVRLNTPELSAALRKILSDFEAQNPGIKIKHEPVSGNLVYPKFLAAVRGQSMPDIAEGLFLPSPAIRRRRTRWSRWTTSSPCGSSNGHAGQHLHRVRLQASSSGTAITGASPTTSISARSTTARTCSKRRGSKPPKPPGTPSSRPCIALPRPGPRACSAWSIPPANFHITQHFYMSFMFQAGGSLLDKDGNLVFGTTAQGRQREGADGS